MHRISAALTTLVVVAVMAPVSVSAKGPVLVGRLEANDAAFWSPPGPITSTEPLSWRLEVLDPDLLLRVALDKSSMANWALEV